MIRMSSRGVLGSRRVEVEERRRHLGDRSRRASTSTTSRTPTQTASAQIRRQALSVPRSARSRWNTGMISVTSV